MAEFRQSINTAIPEIIQLAKDNHWKIREGAGEAFFLRDTIVLSFNMIPTNRLYVARVRHFFSIVTTRPTFHVRWSPGIRLHRAQTLECGRLSLILIIQVI
jgi:hypothetical protein